jgi:hypothetical protein
MFAAIWRVVSLAQTLLVQRSTHGSVNIEENAAYLVEHSLRACLAISGAPKFLHAATNVQDYVERSLTGVVSSMFPRQDAKVNTGHSKVRGY